MSKIPVNPVSEAERNELRAFVAASPTASKVLERILQRLDELEAAVAAPLSTPLLI